LAITKYEKSTGEKKMKKKAIVVAAALLFVAVAAQADITLALNINGAFLNHGGTAYPGDLWAGGGLMQLIWSTVNNYSPSQISNPAGEEPHGLSGWYYVLWSGTLGDISGWSADHDGGNRYYDSDVGSQNIMAGYIYARVFDIAVPTQNTWYASSLIIAASSVNTNMANPDTALDMNEGTDSWYDGDLNARLQPLDHGQVTLVPEPSTLALALAGISLLVYRRFRK
jgi:hypothetical protein